MNKTIRIVDFCPTALSIADGEVLKKEIEKYLETFEKIVLDFDNITLFASPFFNQSIGYFVTKLTPKIFLEKITCINLTELGNQTYNYSYNNACSVYEKSLKESDIDSINNIINNNIENS